MKDLLKIKPEANLVLTGHSSGAIYAAYAGIDIVNNLSTGHLRRVATSSFIL